MAKTMTDIADLIIDAAGLAILVAAVMMIRFFVVDERPASQ